MNESPILLVEDNPDDVTLTLRAFAANQVSNEIIVINDGEHMLSRLLPADGTNRLQPAIILLDIYVPKIDGLELLHHIRADERTSQIPVIMLATSREERDVVESYRLGANSFVRKPVAYTELVRIVRTLSTYWLDINVSCPTGEGPATEGMP